MVWTSNDPRKRVYPYCVIHDTGNRGRKRYELVVTYRANVRSVERFAEVADARRRAQEWFRIPHRPMIFTTRRLEAVFGRPVTLRRAWVALVLRPVDALGTWLFGREAEDPVFAESCREAREAFGEERR